MINKRITKGDIMEQKNTNVSKELEDVNKFLSNVESAMKKDSKNRNKMLKDVEKDLEIHSKKMVEYDRTAKAYKLLEVKYESLKKETCENEKTSRDKIIALKQITENLESENKLLKKVIMNQKRKISGLQSIVELVVNDYGIKNIELVTGLSSDKIKEYFQE